MPFFVQYQTYLETAEKGSIYRKLRIEIGTINLKVVLHTLEYKKNIPKNSESSLMHIRNGTESAIFDKFTFPKHIIVDT